MSELGRLGGRAATGQADGHAWAGALDDDSRRVDHSEPLTRVNNVAIWRSPTSGLKCLRHGLGDIGSKALALGHGNLRLWS
jgi:hypothetical protein